MNKIIFSILLSTSFGMSAQGRVFAPIKLSQPGTLVSIGSQIPGIPEDLNNVVKVSNKYQEHTMVLDAEGKVYYNSIFDIAPLGKPTLTMKWISAGFFHGVGIDPANNAQAWGIDYVGQIDVPSSLIGVKQVEAGNGLSVALKTNGEVVAWGLNFDALHKVPNWTDISKIAIGGSHLLALRKDSTLVAWSSDKTETLVLPNLKNVVDIATGAEHFLALLSNGDVVAWGVNSDGQATVPTQLHNVVKIAAGAYHSLALQEDGEVVAWGRNSDGQCDLTSLQHKVLDLSAGTRTSFFIVDKTITSIKNSQEQNNEMYYHNRALYLNATEAVQIELFDISGHTILKTTASSGPNQIDIQHLQKGIYLAQIQSSKGINILRVLID